MLMLTHNGHCFTESFKTSLELALSSLPAADRSVTWECDDARDEYAMIGPYNSVFILAFEQGCLTLWDLRFRQHTTMLREDRIGAWPGRFPAGAAVGAMICERVMGPSPGRAAERVRAVSFG